MYDEMKYWMSKNNPSCYKPKVQNAGDLRAILNYLYYSGKLNAMNPQIFVPREGLVSMVGAIGMRLAKAHYNDVMQLGAIEDPSKVKYSGSYRANWLGPHFDLTDDKGYFINLDRSRSRAIYQYDRFGSNAVSWVDSNLLEKQNKTRT
jgi:hypothetical protein